MAKTEKPLIDIVIENTDIIHDNLVKVQGLLAEIVAADTWDRITAVGIAGKLLDVCREDIVNTQKYAMRVKEEANNESE